MDDISVRAKIVLQYASMILAEDTRTTGLLLKRFVSRVCLMFTRMEISNRMESLNQENERLKIPMILTHLKEGRQFSQLLLLGKSVALVSDAGTPVLSDPGASLVRSCIDHSNDG